MSQDHKLRHSIDDERRQATRFGRLPEDDYAAIWIGGGEPQLAEVHDESLHGIGLILDADCDIGIGCQAHLVYAGAYHLVRACHVKPHGRDRLLIGFQCERLPELRAPQLDCFLQI